MFAKLEGLEKKYMELEQALAQPDVYNDQDQYRKLTKAHADLRDVVELFRRHRSLTQELEETVALTPEMKKETTKPKPEKTEAEKAEEARREAEARAERERREAEEAARRRLAGAFGKGAKMESRGEGESGKGVQGSPAGNAQTGASTGVGGYGEFNLGGRSIGAGGLPRPVYNVQDEGRVVVTITVNPAGQVVAVEINKQTNTVNPALRKAALDAARKARFNTVDGLNNQVGTITYYFNLK